MFWPPELQPLLAPVHSAHVYEHHTAPMCSVCEHHGTLLCFVYDHHTILLCSRHVGLARGGPFRLAIALQAQASLLPDLES